MLPMNDLAAMFNAAGCAGVRTYIQSGNVVFRASPEVAARIPELISRRLSEDFGYSSPVITRTAAELRTATKHNPFIERGADTRTLHLAFLADRPTAARVRLLDPDRSLPDQFSVRGREVFLACPRGLGRTRLTNRYFDSTLATTTTIRNWRTVLKLVEFTSQ